MEGTKGTLTELVAWEECCCGCTVSCRTASDPGLWVKDQRQRRERWIAAGSQLSILDCSAHFI
ncbi:uncharacterized protein LOC143037616 isoform X2 [Oratosquilla oratoria]|uniref:uncharacterized protein LOC143037616 isoform X2 n=1 Tax=Oratosquilla oratoria TaxID=337810 RepID=UPI003F759A15